MPAPLIPDHTLICRIGAGAYGEVWLARSSLGTLRAVKLVRRADFDDDRPYEREFAGLQKFEPLSRTHEGFVDLLHVGRNDAEGWFYYVMELADAAEPRGSNQWGSNQSLAATPGSSLNTDPPITDYSPLTLAALVKSQGALPLDECVAIARTLTSALAELHRHGLVHRDIKPSNIVFVGGVPKLADVGLVAAARGVGQDRSFVGTEGFIPPEGPGTPAADLYSLGIVLYVLGTGQSHRDFPEPPADLATRPDRERERWLEFSALIHRACQADPRDRYASAAELLADVERLAAGGSVRRHRAWRQRRRLALACAAAAAVGFLGWLAVSRLALSTSNPQPSTASVPASVFILPFRDDGTNGNHLELRGRMTDAFINSLKQLPGVTVAQRRSALAKLPLAEARAEAARLFGVRYVLEGALGASNGLVLNLTLHATGRDRPTWTQRFTGDTNRLIELETQAIHTLAAALSVPVPPEASQRIGGALSNNLAAWRLVQKGRQEFDKITLTAWNVAMEHFNHALQLDPDYLDGLKGKASIIRERTVDQRPSNVWPEINSLAGQMLNVDATDLEGSQLTWMAQIFYDWDWTNGERAFQQRRSQRADGPVVSALYLRMVGRFAEARVEQAKLASLNQKDPYVRNHLAAGAFVERNYHEVLRIARETEQLGLWPGGGLSWQFHGHYHLGEFEAALQTARRSREIQDGPDLKAMEALAQARLGNVAESRQLLAELDADVRHRHVDPYLAAWVHDALGDKVTALRKLREACEIRSELAVFPDLAGGLRTDPKLDELRKEPEFQELLKLAGLDVWPIPEWKP